MQWTKTQVGNASIQLGCGARALDLRPEVENGVVNMHHGGVVVKTPMGEELLPYIFYSRLYRALAGQEC